MSRSPLPLRPTDAASLAGRVAAVLDRHQPPAPDGYPPAPGRLAELVAAARADQRLAACLFALPRAERLAAVERDGDDRFRRPTLARLLSLQAEAALEDATTEAEEAAELAAAVAARLPRDHAGNARRTAALAEWLLGKALLRAGGRGDLATLASLATLADAERAFHRMFGYIGRGQPARERGLACAGLAQLRWRQGRLVEAGALFARAAQELAGVHAVQARAACHALCGLLLVSSRELMLGRLELLKVECLLDVRLAPSLGVVAALGLACCEAGTGRAAAAEGQVARARRLAALVPEGSRAVPRPWLAVAAADAAALGGLEPVLAGFLADPGQDGTAWDGWYPEEIVTLADRLLLGRAEAEPALGQSDSEPALGQSEGEPALGRFDDRPRSTGLRDRRAFPSRGGRRYPPGGQTSMLDGEPP